MIYNSFIGLFFYPWLWPTRFNADCVMQRSYATEDGTMSVTILPFDLDWRFIDGETPQVVSARLFVSLMRLNGQIPT